MSGTKSPSPKAPATDEDQAPIEALIVSHGQPSDPEPAEEALAEYAAVIQAALPDHVIRSATLAAPGKLEAQLAQMEDGGVIYPLFMADGWFVRTALIKRISEAALGIVVSIMPPYGLASSLPKVAAENVRKELAATGSDKLLVVAHGSAFGDAPAASARLFTDRLQAELPDLTIELGFLEQEPSIGDKAKALGPGAICLPFFAMKGDHVRLDVPAALKMGGFEGTIMPSISHIEGAEQIAIDALSLALSKRRRG
ncbi:CbiX/SirB N-terminal domain-containing protein [Aliiroseovarius crassostreae]|uniref:CbiX/SirB N-terminal domain-containing protein n=1 Tax=Aliiroseovarius crassostreae TaxID=154981 RepID=UPI00220149E9|nr:CbiX/SirB N-terminal domain-containing protein [Aliiroseovarius crassostreae]UWQ07666.1 CbiX/SirB N-terminal domain-containing protein [Aliiroseovarius crassostreae]